MKVSELEGSLLDYWVGKAEGKDDAHIVAGWMCRVREKNGIGHEYFPSTNWMEGGPIIERERIKLEPIHSLRGGVFLYWNAKALVYILSMDGETALVAAMRCYVASKYGEEVPDQ